LLGLAWAAAGLAGARASGAPRRIEAKASAHGNFATLRRAVEVCNPSYGIASLLTFVVRAGPAQSA
jgi:hypothetical protein